jgi:hypothetical protein
MSQHLRDKYKTPIKLQRQVEQYMKEFPFAYSYASVALPLGGLAPQPIIPVVDKVLC